jgi:hypothetical protein
MSAETNSPQIHWNAAEHDGSTPQPPVAPEDQRNPLLAYLDSIDQKASVMVDQTIDWLRPKPGEVRDQVRERVGQTVTAGSVAIDGLKTRRQEQRTERRERMRQFDSYIGQLALKGLGEVEPGETLDRVVPKTRHERSREKRATKAVQKHQEREAKAESLRIMYGSAGKVRKWHTRAARVRHAVSTERDYRAGNIDAVERRAELKRAVLPERIIVTKAAPKVTRAHHRHQKSTNHLRSAARHYVASAPAPEPIASAPEPISWMDPAALRKLRRSGPKPIKWDSSSEKNSYIDWEAPTEAITPEIRSTPMEPAESRTQEKSETEASDKPDLRVVRNDEEILGNPFYSSLFDQESIRRLDEGIHKEQTDWAHEVKDRDKKEEHTEADPRRPKQRKVLDQYWFTMSDHAAEDVKKKYVLGKTGQETLPPEVDQLLDRELQKAKLAREEKARLEREQRAKERKEADTTTTPPQTVSPEKDDYQKLRDQFPNA